MADPYLGEIRMAGFNFAPYGWSLCAGQVVPLSQNTALFALLGTQFGGDGVSTFALPVSSVTGGTSRAGIAESAIAYSHTLRRCFK